MVGPPSRGDLSMAAVFLDGYHSSGNQLRAEPLFFISYCRTPRILGFPNKTGTIHHPFDSRSIINQGKEQVTSAFHSIEFRSEVSMHRAYLAGLYGGHSPGVHVAVFYCELNKNDKYRPANHLREVQKYMGYK